MTKIEFTPIQLANRVQWVRDLVSGDYVQGHGSLKRWTSSGNVLHCCLGVASEKLCPTSPHLRPEGDPLAGESTTSEGGTLPRSAARLLGMGDHSEELGGDQKTAYTWNDNDHYSFERIADFIAWATEYGVPLTRVYPPNVPTDYAATWLEGLERAS